MAIQTESIQIKYILDNKEAIRNLGLLQDQYDNLKTIQKEVANSDDPAHQQRVKGIIEQRKEIENLTDKVKELKKTQETSNKPTKEKREESKALNAELKAAKEELKRRQEEYTSSTEYKNQLADLEKRIADERAVLGDYGLTAKELNRIIKENSIKMGNLAPNSEEAIQLKERNQRLNTIKNGGFDSKEIGQGLLDIFQKEGMAALKMKELDTLASHLFKTIKEGSQVGQMEQHELYQDFLKVNAAIGSIDDLNKKNIKAEREYQATLKQTINTQKLEANSIEHLREFYKLLNKELEQTNDLESNTGKIDLIQNVADTIKKKESLINGTGGFLGKIFGGEATGALLAGGVAGAITGGLSTAFALVLGGWRDVVNKIKEKAQELTVIQNAFDVTRQQAKAINDDLSSIDTGTTVAELNKLVALGGDINITKREIHGFVEEGDKIGQVLAGDFDSTEQAVEMLAKLRGEFKETKNLDMAEHLRRTGSALKEINADGPASTKGITDFLKRAGTIPNVLKPAIQELIGYGAVFEEANISAELSATNFSKIITVGSTNTATFAKQMKLSKDATTDLINTKPNEFVLKLAESLSKLKGSDLAQTMKNLKLEGGEVYSVMGVIIDNIEKIRTKQKLANQAYDDGTRIQRNFNEINKDQAAQIDKTAKAWDIVKTKMVSIVALLAGPLLQWTAGMAKQADSVTTAYTKQSQQLKDVHKNVVPLVSEYKKLQEDAKKGADNHERLNQVIQQLGNFVPGAVSQWGSYGQAISINIGLMDDFIKKQEEAFKNKKNTLKQTTNEEIYAAYKERNKLISVINNISKSGDYLIHKQLVDTYRTKINEYNGVIVNARKTLKDLETDIKITDTKGDKDKPIITEPPTLTQKKSGKKDDSYARYLQEEDKKLTELRAKAAFDERLRLASEQEKKKLLIDKQAEDEITKLKETFKTKDGIVIEFAKLSKEKQELITQEELLIKEKATAEKLEIDKEYLRKSDKLYEDAANQTVKIAQDAKAQELREKKAKAKDGTLASYNADVAIINNNTANDVFATRQDFAKQKIEAEGNSEALQLIAENEKNAIIGIEKRATSERDALWEKYYKSIQQKAKDNNIKLLQLKVEEADFNHQDSYDEKVALLEAEHILAVNAAREREEDISVIEAEFRLKRKQLDEDHTQGVLGEVIKYYSKAFSTITNLIGSDIQNRIIESENATNTAIDNINRQKDAQVITSRQAAKEEKIIRDKADKEQKKLKKEQFELDKAAKLSQIIIETVKAVMAAGGPLTPFGALTAAAGAVEFGLAASQKFPGYEEGSFVKSTNQNLPMVKPSSTAVLAWLNEKGTEYVVPNWQLNDPYVAEMVNEIEHRRKNKITGKPEIALETGGHSSTTSISTPTTNYSGDFREAVDELGKHIDTFRTIIESGIHAYTIIDEQDIYKLEQKKVILQQKLNAANTSSSNTLLP